MTSSESAPERKRRKPPVADPLPPGRPEDDLLTAPQVALLLHMSLRTVFKLIAEGTLPARRLPGTRKLLFRRGDVLAVVLASVVDPDDLDIEAEKSISDAE